MINIFIQLAWLDFAGFRYYVIYDTHLPAYKRDWDFGRGQDWDDSIVARTGITPFWGFSHGQVLAEISKIISKKNTSDTKNMAKVLAKITN